MKTPGLFALKPLKMPDYTHSNIKFLHFRHFLASLRLLKRLGVYAPVAQLDRASDYESEGWEFESLRARHSTKCSPKGGAFLLTIVPVEFEVWQGVRCQAIQKCAAHVYAAHPRKSIAKAGRAARSAEKPISSGAPYTKTPFGGFCV